MKKYNTLLIVVCSVLFIALLTWILPITYLSSGELVTDTLYRVGIADLFSYPIYTFYNFIYVLVYVLLVGALYGVLNKTKAYRLLLERIAKRYEGLESLFFTLVVIIMATIISFTGFTYEAILVLPFLAGIIYLLGFDKITVALTFVGTCVVGFVGNTFSSTIVGTFNDILSIEFTNLWLAKVILLVVGCALLIFNIIRYNKKHEGLFDKVEENVFIPEKVSLKDKGVKVWPLVTTLIITVIVMIMGAVNWSSAFGVEFFTNLNTKFGEILLFNKYIGLVVFGLVVIGMIMYYIFKRINTGKKNFIKTLTIPGFVIFCISALVLLGTVAKIILVDVCNVTVITNAFTKVYETLGLNDVYVSAILGTTTAFGSWTYNDYCLFLMIVIVAVSLIYKIRLTECGDAIVEGTKKVLYAALVCMLGYTLLILNSNHPVVLTALKPILNLTDGFNNLTLSFCSFISGLFSTDMTYYQYGLLTLDYVTGTITDTSLYGLCEVITQSMYGIAMLVAPTSCVLLFTLSTLGITFGEWYKKVWKLLVELLVVCLVAFVVILQII